jgi:hypothetical protein
MNTSSSSSSSQNNNNNNNKKKRNIVNYSNDLNSDSKKSMIEKVLKATAKIDTTSSSSFHDKNNSSSNNNIKETGQQCMIKQALEIVNKNEEINIKNTNKREFSLLENSIESGGEMRAKKKKSNMFENINNIHVGDSNFPPQIRASIHDEEEEKVTLFGNTNIGESMDSSSKDSVLTQPSVEAKTSVSNHEGGFDGIQVKKEKNFSLFEKKNSNSGTIYINIHIYMHMYMCV